jgi:hypothetical protein
MPVLNLNLIGLIVNRILNDRTTRLSTSGSTTSTTPYRLSSGTTYATIYASFEDCTLLLPEQENDDSAENYYKLQNQ